MNMRLLYVVLIVQCLFAGSLIYLGRQSRANRKYDYLELTHRVTNGQARVDDYGKLASFLPPKADKTDVRSLFGLPLLRVAKIEFEDGTTSEPKGEAWLYYPATGASAEKPTDIQDVMGLKGTVTCFVAEFDERGRAVCGLKKVKHPVTPK